MRPLLAAVLLAAAACGDPTGRGGGEWQEVELVYERTTEAGPQLVALRLDGTAPVPVLSGATRGMHAAISRDMRRMLFVQDDPLTTGREVWVANRDGSGATQLTDHPEIDDSPAWSPDGRHVAFRSWRSERAGEIWVMRASDGGGRLRLTSTLDHDDDPAWSPDGSTLLFTRSSPDGTYIMAVPAAGGTPVRLTHVGHASMPAWAPDGAMIAFTRRDTPTGRPEIYTMRADGSDVRLRTVDPAWGGGQNPTWRGAPGEG